MRKYLAVLILLAMMLSGCVSTAERLEQAGARAEKLVKP